MNQYPHLDELKSVGMTEYEAKVYSTLFSARLASATEIHNITNIPRGRVYETLNSLKKKGFVNAYGKSPVWFRAEDLSLTLEKITREKLASIEKMRDCLTRLESEHNSRELLKKTALKDERAITRQVSLMFQRAKTEMVILCNSPLFIQMYEKELLDLQKKLPLYIVVTNEQFAKNSNVKCYLGGKDMNELLLGNMLFSEGDAFLMRVVIYANRRETLLLLEEGDAAEGLFVANDLFAEFVIKKVLEETVPVSKK
ncbi:MAG: helix-turn-helix domain-containing protein [Methanocorpusculum sp.]|nr:helix-turn-helix domain-containing protein [Methanocorpusculum sp.]